ncbi:16400_t:CDS:1, partial [Racocetra persica]
NLISTYGDVTNQEIPNNQLIQDFNKRPLRNFQITNLELQNLPIYTSPDNIQEKAPIFNNCQFQNINFYFQ